MEHPTISPWSYDRRLPVTVVLPQVAVPLLSAGDVRTAQVVFLLTVTVNVPMSLAGRAFAARPDRSIPDGLLPLVEWARPAASVAYALLLLSVSPYATGVARDALVPAAVASLVAGALAYVVPGSSTPSGARLRNRRLAGTTWRNETPSFHLARASRVLTPAAVVAVLGGAPVVALVLLLLACGTALTAASIRPRNAVDRTSWHTEQERTH